MAAKMRSNLLCISSQRTSIRASIRCSISAIFWSRAVLSQVFFVAVDALAGAAEAGDEGGKGEDLCALTNA